MLIDHETYRKAFVDYLRTGTSIERSLKETRGRGYYVWHSRGDERVRSSHAENDGRVFSWDDPPPTGHPGEDYNCRCWAEEFNPNIVEYMNIDLQNVADTGAPWTNLHFVDHYLNGGGQGVTVRETGHLVKIVNRYLDIVGEDLKGQFADAVRRGNENPYRFGRSYQMEGVVFSIGDTTIGGKFYWNAEEKRGVASIAGNVDFYLNDEFRDPLDIGTVLPEPLATIDEDIAQGLAEFDQYFRDIVDAYFEQLVRQRRSDDTPLTRKDLREFAGPFPIRDKWSAIVSGQVFLDRSWSKFKK